MNPRVTDRTCPAGAPTQARGGYTLIEAVLGTAIAVIILAGVVGVMFLAYGGLSSGADKADNMSRQSRAIQMITLDLSLATAFSQRSAEAVTLVRTRPQRRRPARDDPLQLVRHAGRPPHSPGQRRTTRGHRRRRAPVQPDLSAQDVVSPSPLDAGGGSMAGVLPTRRGGLSMNPPRSSANRHGLTLVEAAISVVILAVLITMVLNTFGSLAKARQLGLSRNIATGLANQLLSEVVQNFYVDPSGPSVFGPETGEAGTSRAQFDDVDDYHNWTESPPQFKDGSTIPGLVGWARKVTVEHIDPDTMAPSGATDRGVKKISVTVTDPRGVSTTVVALRSKAGVYDVRPVSQTKCVGWVGVALQIGSDSSTRAYSGTNMLNTIPAGGP